MLHSCYDRQLSDILHVLNFFRMSNSVYQFLSEMIACVAVLFFLWAMFQLVSYVWVKCAQINRRIRLQDRLAENDVRDRQLWAVA